VPCRKLSSMGAGRERLRPPLTVLCPTPPVNIPQMRARTIRSLVLQALRQGEELRVSPPSVELGQAVLRFAHVDACTTLVAQARHVGEGAERLAGA